MNRILTLLMAAMLFSFQNFTLAQDTTDYALPKKHVIIKNDGTQYVGVILSNDDREILIETTTIGKVYIPKHEIKEIRELKEGELDGSGRYIGNEEFDTRYFLTTNGFPIKKGDSYMLWNLYGPDFQFGLSDHFSMGVMTTWIASPIGVTAKYSGKLSDKVSVGVGGIFGTTSYIDPGAGLALPFVALTVGDSRTNVNISAGYGAVFGNGAGGRAVFSLGFMARASSKVSIVFDSIFAPELEDDDVGNLTFLFPGIRWNTAPGKAFQFGFGAFSYSESNSGNGDDVSWDSGVVPFPMLSWFRKF
jgi:hypothetical protein